MSSSEYAEIPRVDELGRRRPLELTAKLRAVVEANITPIPRWGLQKVDEMVYHLYWPGARALCGIRATREPAVAPDSPFLCGTCAWKFEIATGRELPE